MGLVKYEGSHGTSKSRADVIMKDGFKSGTGRAGSGTYFWYKSRHYISLARAWYRQSLKKTRYAADTDRGCVIIVAELQAEENAILDMEDPDMKDRIAELAEANRIPLTDFHKISALYDMFIRRLETKLGNTFAILLIRVAPPDKAFCPDYPLNIIGAPLCCVARNTKCITIKNLV